MNGYDVSAIPVATYRLQLSRDFTFDQASEVLSYLAALGISHVYCSPFLKARAGSGHGYDVVDYSRINPELGGEPGFTRFCAVLQEHKLGLILDFVPNHMGVGHADNQWWLDVLEWGQASPYSRYFDIDWSPPRRDLEGKVLLPILGQNYGAALSAGEITLRFDAPNGALNFWYFDHRLPVSPRDYPSVLGPLADSASFEESVGLLQESFVAGDDLVARRNAATLLKTRLAAMARDPAMGSAIAEAAASWQGQPGDPSSYTPLHELLERQAFRLAHWHAAADEINYRRFFDIQDLAGVRMDRIAVFRDTHALMGRLLADGKLQGLRIDHVDGLADPQRYCRRLNAFATILLRRNGGGRRVTPYIVVEKILTGEEKLPANWPVFGTTGYDYLALINGIFINPQGYAKLQRHWSRFAGTFMDLEQEIYDCRRLVIDRSLASELTFLANLLVEISEADWFTRDFTRKRLRDALVEIVAAFGVYRTYVTERGTGDADREEIAKAIAAGRRRWNGADGQILDFIGSLLTLDIAGKNPEHYAAQRAAIHRFVARFQQYTGAISAKAVEDTMFYRYIPLVSANEVGATLRHPATSPDDFHAKMLERHAAWPHGMSATATHDTKRGEDTRARLNVLSEIPDEWSRRVARWHVYNRVHRDETQGRLVPSMNDEYLLYQSVVGTWPMQIGAVLRSGAGRRDYLERLKAYAIKACREAKLASSWTAPDEAYERGLVAFIERIFEQPRRTPFLDSLLRFLPPLTRLGAFSSLSQLVLKAISPGVPDFYQGSEFWDFSLVDPDNRRPVDYRARSEALGALDFGTAVARWREGWIKLWVTRQLLDLRGRLSGVFAEGSYTPLTIGGAGGESLIGFERRAAQGVIAVLACRRFFDRSSGDPATFWSGDRFFCNTLVGIEPNRRWRDSLTGATVESSTKGVTAAEALSLLPVAVLVAD